MRKWLVVLVLLFGGNLYAHSIIVDGDPADWIGATLSQNDTAYIDAGEAIWIDTPGDDIGDGGDALSAQDDTSAYTYPTDTTFTGGEADIIQCRLTADTQNLYFLIQLDTFASFYYPMVVITMDIDHVSGSGQEWIPRNADLKVAPEIAWEYAIVLADNNVRVFDSDWVELTDSVQAQVVFNPNGGYIEVGLNARLLSPDMDILDTVVYYTCMAGLNEFGEFKEVDSVASQWHGGGGLGENGNADSPYWIEPDVYDLAFVPSDDQVNDLNTYDDVQLTPSVIRATSAIPVRMSDVSLVRENGYEKDLNLPVVFAQNGRIVFDGNITRVTIYSRTGAKLGEFEGKNVSLSLPYGAYFALVKSDRGQRLYRIVNAK